MKKPLTPYAHGISDYLFAVLYTALPKVLKVNKKAQKLYTATALIVTANNAMTNSSPHIAGVLSTKAHKRNDEMVLAAMTIMSAAKFIRDDKKTLSMHLFLMAASLANYMLTDWKHE